MIMLNVRNLLLAITSLVLATFLFCVTPLMADNSDSEPGWQYAAELYLWAPQITANTPRGDADLPFYRMIDDLQFTFMGAIGARKDKWTLLTDLVYLDVKQGVKGAEFVSLLRFEQRGSTCLVSLYIFECG